MLVLMFIGMCVEIITFMIRDVEEYAEVEEKQSRPLSSGELRESEKVKMTERKKNDFESTVNIRPQVLTSRKPTRKNI